MSVKSDVPVEIEKKMMWQYVILLNFHALIGEEKTSSENRKVLEV